MNTILPRSETEAFLLEKFQSLLAELDAAIRKLAAEILEKKIQKRINAAEQSDKAKQCPQ